MFRMPLRRVVGRIAVASLALAAPLALTPNPASAASTTDLLISEYVEGSSTYKALELYNGTAASVDLDAGSYAVDVYFNGATSPTRVALHGTVAAGDVFVVGDQLVATARPGVVDQPTSAGLWNGDDAVALVKGGVLLDVIGQIGTDPGTAWESGGISTKDQTLRRHDDVCTGDTDGSDAFDPSVQWDGVAKDDLSGLGAHALGTCAGAGGGDGGSGGDPTPTCATGWTPTYAIEGDGPGTPLAGRTVTTHGVVVADYEGRSPALRGFYLQDPVGDGVPGTSDAVFVFNGNRDDVTVGDVVQVTGTAGEYQGQTQVSASAVLECGQTGVALAPTVISLPMAGPDGYERYEGMLVRYDQTLSVTEHYQLGRFGQVTVSSGGRLRQPTNVVEPGPAALALQAENDLNRVIIDDTLNNQNPDPIIWGRGGRPLSAENTLRGGDTTTGATGVMTYTWAGSSASGNAWRLRPVDQTGAGITFEAANPRPTTPDVGGAVRVAGMNLLNYFNTFDGIPDRVDSCTGGVDGAPMDCRGADDPVELARQTAKTVAAIAALDADVIGVNEIENDGYGPDSAIATLVDAVNAEVGGGTYAFIDADAATGQTNALGADAIKVGFLYRPAAVTPVGRTAVLNTEEFVTGGDADPRNRPSLAQAWKSTETGGVFTVDVNHLKSKGSACDAPDAGDGQANCAVVRTNAVHTLLDWLATDPTGTGDPDVLLVGDDNSYAKEDPIQVLEAGGFTNLIERFQGEDAYSYVFDGQWGYLDQAMASGSMLAQVSGAADHHINADEPSVLDYNTNFKSAGQVEDLYASDEYRVSDHDPVVIGVNPYVDAAFSGPLEKPDRVVKAGSTVPVKVVLSTSVGGVPTDLHLSVAVRQGETVLASGTMRYVDGEWVYLLRTGELPGAGAYTVTVTVEESGQTVSTGFTLR